MNPATDSDRLLSTASPNRGPAKRCGVALELREAREALADPDLVRDWENILNVYRYQDVLYAAPPWIANMVEARSKATKVWVARDSAGEMVGVVPVSEHEFRLKYEIKSRTLFSVAISTVGLHIAPLCIPADEELYAAVLDQSLEAFPGRTGLYIEGVPIDSALFRYLSRGGSMARSFLRFFPKGERMTYSIDLPESLATYYAAQMSSKSRRNLERQVRQFCKHAGGRLELRRFTEPDAVPAFLADASRVSRMTWKRHILGERFVHTEATRRFYEDLARRGLLRSYVLHAAGEPCAFGLGYQFAGTYHYLETGYDPSVAHFSPGTSMFILMLEDLFAHDRPERVNLGLEGSFYKKHFSNRAERVVTCLLLKDSLRHRLIAASHAGLARLIELAKRVGGRPAPVAEGAGEGPGGSE
jgi:CelD/BcsL family acetyltransferase involved in cellulose biosynthesis